MRQALDLITKTFIAILLFCCATKVNSAPAKTSECCSIQYSQNGNFYAKKVGIPVSYSTAQTKIKRSKSKKDTQFKNYVYIKAGVARTQYDKFKDGEDSIYIVKKPDVGLMYQIGIGHQFTKSIRGDLILQYGELTYKGADEMFDLKQKIRLFSTLVNGYYDIPIKNIFIAYLTAGLGVGNNSTSDLNDSSSAGFKWKGKNTTNIVWNIGTGIKFDLTKRFSLNLGYKYLNLSKAKTKSNADGAPKTQKITANQIMGALIYNF